MDYTARMAAVTRTALHRYARRYVCDAPAVVGVLVPRGRGVEVRPAVDAFVAALAKPSPPGAAATP